MHVPFCLGKVAHLFDSAAKSVASAIDARLDTAPENTPVEIDGKLIIDAVPEQLRELAQTEVGSRIFALRFESNAEPGRVHSAWLLKSIREAERDCECEVSLKIGNWYVRKAEFIETVQQVRIVAAGKDPKLAVLYVYQEDTKFDSKMFDVDGYTKVIDID